MSSARHTPERAARYGMLTLTCDHRRSEELSTCGPATTRSPLGLVTRSLRSAGSTALSQTALNVSAESPHELYLTIGVAGLAVASVPSGSIMTLSPETWPNAL